MLTLPNVLTLSRILAVPLLAFLLWWPEWQLGYALAFVLYCLMGVTDYFDGYLARSSGTVSKLGVFLDPIADKIMVAAAILVLTAQGYLRGPYVGDAHVIAVDKSSKMLYELYTAKAKSNEWQCASAAKFDLTSDAERPAGWTSADAAGLPIFPGLVRTDEVIDAGVINHALRFTVQDTQKGYVDPARHYASNDTSAKLPPMGLRVRLKASVDISQAGPQAQVILTALKKYGMIVADNGSNWFISGAPDARWDDDDLHTLGKFKGSDFEVVKHGPISTDGE